MILSWHFTWYHGMVNYPLSPRMVATNRGERNFTMSFPAVAFFLHTYKAAKGQMISQTSGHSMKQGRTISPNKSQNIANPASDKAAQCDCCSKWEHYVCAGLAII